MIPTPANTVLIFGKDANSASVPIGANAATAAAGTLTSDNTVVTTGDTVTIGGTAYTFKTALTGADNEILIVAADADNTLLNLINAINGSGAKINGVDYLTKLQGGHPLVTAATAVTAHAFVVTARDTGSTGNLIASTETSNHLSWGSTTLTGGSNGCLATGARQLAGTPSSFTIGTSDQTVFTLAAGEIGYIQNLDDAALAVKYGAGASTTSLSFILRAGSAADDGNGPIMVIDDHVGIVSVAAMSGAPRYIAFKRS